MSNLRKQVIKLAYEKKHLRPILLPILKEAQFKKTPFKVPGWFGGIVEIEGNPMSSEPYTHEEGTYVQGRHNGKSFLAKFVGGGRFVLTRGGDRAAEQALAKVGPQIAAKFKLR